MKSVILGILVVLASCSKSMAPKELTSQNPAGPNQSGEIVRSLEASVATVTSPSGVEVDGIVNVDFGTILNTESKSLRATIRNNSTAGETIVSATRVASAENYFTQVSSNCSNIKPKSSCDIRMSFNGKVAPQNEGGDFSGQWVLTFSDNTTKTVQMNINVTLPAPTTPEEVAAQQSAQLANLTFEPVSIDFGEILETESKTMSIIVRNNNSVPVTFVTSVQQPFTLTTGCSTISAKSTCTARVALSGAGKSGSQAGVLTYGTRSVPLSGVVKTQAQVIAETPLELNISSSVESIDFGNINPDGISTRNISFTNNSNLPVNIPTVLSSADYRITSNSCNNKQVAVKGTCSVRLALSGAGKPAGPLAPATFSYGNKSIPLSGEIMSAAEVALIEQEQAQLLSNIVLDYQGLQYSPADTLDLGSKSQGATEQIQFVLRNTGSAPATISSVSFASNVSIVSSNCSTRLSPNSSCNIRASLNPQSQAPLNLSANLGFEIRTFPISFTLVGSSGLEDNLLCSHLTAQQLSSNFGINVAQVPGWVLVGSTYEYQGGPNGIQGYTPNCFISGCNQFYEQSDASLTRCTLKACSNLDSGELIEAGFIDDASGSIGYNPQEHLSGTYPNCSISCPSGFEPDPNNIKRCRAVQDVVSYQIAYSNYGECSFSAPCLGIGEQSRTYTCNKLVNGNLDSVVSNSFCSSQEDALVIGCPSPEGTIPSPIEGGTQTLYCAEGSTVSIFQSVSCTEPGYEQNGDVCGLQQSLACDLGNAGPEIVLTNVLTLSGNVGACEVASCEINYIPSLDKKSCEGVLSLIGDDFLYYQPLKFINNQLHYIGHNYNSQTMSYKVDNSGLFSINQVYIVGDNPLIMSDGRAITVSYEGEFGEITRVRKNDPNTMTSSILYEFNGMTTQTNASPVFLHKGGSLAEERVVLMMSEHFPDTNEYEYSLKLSDPAVENFTTIYTAPRISTSSMSIYLSLQIERTFEKNGNSFIVVSQKQDYGSQEIKIIKIDTQGIASVINLPESAFFPSFYNPIYDNEGMWEKQFKETDNYLYVFLQRYNSNGNVDPQTSIEKLLYQVQISLTESVVELKESERIFMLQSEASSYTRGDLDSFWKITNFNGVSFQYVAFTDMIIGSTGDDLYYSWHQEQIQEGYDYILYQNFPEEATLLPPEEIADDPCPTADASCINSQYRQALLVPIIKKISGGGSPVVQYIGENPLYSHLNSTNFDVFNGSHNAQATQFLNINRYRECYNGYQQAQCFSNTFNGKIIFFSFNNQSSKVHWIDNGNISFQDLSSVIVPQNSSTAFYTSGSSMFSFAGGKVGLMVGQRLFVAENENQLFYEVQIKENPDYQREEYRIVNGNLYFSMRTSINPLTYVFYKSDGNIHEPFLNYSNSLYETKWRVYENRHFLLESNPAQIFEIKK